MNRREIMERLTVVFRDVFEDDSLVITEETNAKDIEEWDSLTHVSLIVAVQEEFDIHFSVKDIIGMKNVGEMMDIIEEEA